MLTAITVLGLVGAIITSIIGCILVNISKDGIYKITPEEWWELNVPIIAETK